MGLNKPMEKELLTTSQAFKKTRELIKQQCFHPSEVELLKKEVRHTYTSWANMFYHKSFLNWGLWDKKIYREYLGLDFDFSTICPYQDITSPLLYYFLIRPLVQNHFFHKRILEIGCGNGIGLKLCSELLQSEYALGIDLTNRLALNAHSNFYNENKINYIQSDSEHLPLKNESFDVLINLESAHLYPCIDDFFSEVERVLAPGGFFCCADVHFEEKMQAQRLEAFFNTKPDLKIIQKKNITKMVQASLYRRMIRDEDKLFNYAKTLFGNETHTLLTEFTALINAMGLTFLPWWKIRFNNPQFQLIAKNARKTSFWRKKNYFYYLIQKT